MAHTYYVYILASARNGTLYVGVTNDLSRRVQEHKNGTVPGFTSKHGVDRLVWYQPFDLIDDAIAHEKRVKRWARKWKLELIEKMNPRWADLYETTLLP
ncbi:MAG: GIY-YIG nuclease family protein [Micropepsaceae bacterium]